MTKLEKLMEKIILCATLQIEDNIKDGSVDEKDKTFEIKTLVKETYLDFEDEILTAFEDDIEEMVAKQN